MKDESPIEWAFRKEREEIVLCSDCGIKWKPRGKQCPVCYAPKEKEPIPEEKCMIYKRDGEHYFDAQGNRTCCLEHKKA